MPTADLSRPTRVLILLMLAALTGQMTAFALQDALPADSRNILPNTAYSIEFSATTNVREWGGQDVRIGCEDDAVFTRKGCRFIDGHQTSLLLIR